MSNFSDFFGGGGIKSVQRGVATPTSVSELSVTVAAVNPAKSMLNMLSVRASTSTTASGNDCVMSVRLINATTIGVLAYTAKDGQGVVYHACSWELIEFA